MTDTRTQLVKSYVVFARISQVALVCIATLLVLGSVLGGVNVIAFLAITTFSLLLLAFAGVLEIGIRVGRGWVA